MKLSFTSPIVGAKHRPPAGLILQCLGMGQALFALREPENPYDPNAISIRITFDDARKAITDPDQWDSVRNLWEANNGFPDQPPESFHLGYVPRELAAKWAETMDGELKRRREANAPGLEVMANPDFPATLGFNPQGFPEVTVEI